MPPKSLKVTVPINAESSDAAIAELSEQFLRATKSGVRVVRQPTDFRLSELCSPLSEGWTSGKVAYSKGEITLVFSAGQLSSEADLVIYSPTEGDRFLYSKSPSADSSPPSERASAYSSLTEDAAQELNQRLQHLTEMLSHLTGHPDAVQLHLNDSPVQQRALEQALTAQTQEFQNMLGQALEAQAAAFNGQLQTALEAQATKFAQILSTQITSTALHFSERLDALQQRIAEMSARLSDLEMTADAPELPVPQTETDWLERCRETWGTVGDYEQYSLSYREANAETPLFYTPDWIALCTVDWARKLKPTLAFLYDLIYGKDGVGEIGADILQQFGQHVDPQTGDRYYIYQRGGFSAYEAFWQTVNDPQYSWLTELQHLSNKLGKRRQEIFQLFGWEAAAIDALERVIERVAYGRQTHDRSSHAKAGDTLSDYLTLLNIGPFTPLTLETVKRAYKQAMKTAHPDAGGSKEQAQRVNEAYKVVLEQYFPDAI